MADAAEPKRVIVHVGPHKTGSTALQKCLSAAGPDLAAAGIIFLHGEATHIAATALAVEQFDTAEQRLAALSEVIAGLPASCILLSQEDFAGALPGRSRKRQIYPKLTKNLRILKRALRPHQVWFVFFRREEQAWLRSCYHQHLRYRTRFWRFEDFAAHFGAFSWEEKLAKPRETFGEEFIDLPWSGEPQAGVSALLELAGAGAASLPRLEVAPVNASPSPAQIAGLERINELTDFGPTAWFAKSFVLGERERPAPAPSPGESEPWPPQAGAAGLGALPSLAKRVALRVQHQPCEDILPPLDVDLAALAQDRLPDTAELPEVPRADIRDQARILEYHLRGKSRLSHLNALSISYLRRDTGHTEKARHLFHRVWQEMGVELVNETPTRWLISTLQTFLDHGLNEAQRSIGTAGYFYANMMKIYEGERAIEGLEQDAVYKADVPSTANRFRGLDRYRVGASDLMLNTNALALEIAQRDASAGLVLQELLLRVSAAETVFSRHDRTRALREIDVPGFENTWAFFEPRRG
jgi:hypothetical protein